MNIFENNITEIGAFIEGYNLLQQAGLPIEARFSFEFEEKHAMEDAFKGVSPCVSPSFTVPMWFIRAIRKHKKLYGWSSYGHTDKSWVSRYNSGVVELKSWELGGRAFQAEVIIRTRCGLVFFTTRKWGE